MKKLCMVCRRHDNCWKVIRAKMKTECLQIFLYSVAQGQQLSSLKKKRARNNGRQARVALVCFDYCFAGLFWFLLFFVYVCSVYADGKRACVCVCVCVSKVSDWASLAIRSTGKIESVASEKLARLFVFVLILAPSIVYENRICRWQVRVDKGKIKDKFWVCVCACVRASA